MAYSDKVLDHYENPRNVGSMDKADATVGTGLVGSPEQGDVMKLQIKVDDRDPYARFRDRLMIPIHDPRGRVIGFAGRILDAAKKDAPKYLNSPDTPLFDKGRTLFNLHRASPAARQSGRMGDVRLRYGGLLTHERRRTGINEA